MTNDEKIDFIYRSVKEDVDSMARVYEALSMLIGYIHGGIVKCENPSCSECISSAEIIDKTIRILPESAQSVFKRSMERSKEKVNQIDELMKVH